MWTKTVAMETKEPLVCREMNVVNLRVFVGDVTRAASAREDVARF